ncbi:hypothetical protein ACH5RR_033025 [Cinchona calisaya]|uniref:Disease resistance protein n=1 Tax=Cinchona calisaya TaxID=153742 RepID=A0ABD2YJT3_9GENT
MCCNIHELRIYASTPLLRSKLPKHEPHFCLSLQSLVLSGSEIEEDPMETLEKLPNLTFLELCWHSFLGKHMICHAKGFSQLRHLVIKNLPNLEKWTVEKEAMPHLSTLIIWDCAKLEMIPDGLRFITTLQNLDIFGVSQVCLQRLQEGDEDFSTFYNVNRFSIY